MSAARLTLAADWLAATGAYAAARLADAARTAATTLDGIAADVRAELATPAPPARRIPGPRPARRLVAAAGAAAALPSIVPPPVPAGRTLPAVVLVSAFPVSR